MHRNLREIRMQPPSVNPGKHPPQKHLELTPPRFLRLRRLLRLARKPQTPSHRRKRNVRDRPVHPQQRISQVLEVAVVPHGGVPLHAAFDVVTPEGEGDAIPIVGEAVEDADAYGLADADEGDEDVVGFADGLHRRGRVGEALAVGGAVSAADDYVLYVGIVFPEAVVEVCHYCGLPRHRIANPPRRRRRRRPHHPTSILARHHRPPIPNHGRARRVTPNALRKLVIEERRTLPVVRQERRVVRRLHVPRIQQWAQGAVGGAEAEGQFRFPLSGPVGEYAELTRDHRFLSSLLDEGPFQQRLGEGVDYRSFGSHLLGRFDRWGWTLRY
mmetsp:Transcript_11619/g.25099  ORF Transcript_11619/g.25099 Transcript_11619/m.25099 type:complete len:328 (+) Transcript_11619:711-1694(+)